MSVAELCSRIDNKSKTERGSCVNTQTGSQSNTFISSQKPSQLSTVPVSSSCVGVKECPKCAKLKFMRCVDCVRLGKAKSVRNRQISLSNNIMGGGRRPSSSSNLPFSNSPKETKNPYSNNKNTPVKRKLMQTENTQYLLSKFESRNILPAALLLGCSESPAKRRKVQPGVSQNTKPRD